jgi:uncharacterized protein
MHTRFEWDENKNAENIKKHGVNFEVAQYAFLDLRRVISEDIIHSDKEKRYFCLGIIGGKVLTVRFTYRGKIIRIIGAGFWRKGKEAYEKQNGIY